MLLQIHSMAPVCMCLCMCVHMSTACSGQQLHSSGKRGQAHGQHLPASAACAAESGSYATGAPCSVEDKPCGRLWTPHMVCTKAISASNFGQTARQFDQIAGSFDPLASKLDQITSSFAQRASTHCFCLSQFNDFQSAILAASSIH
jgi:hypothetical protein